MIDALVSHGALVSATSRDRKTPAHIAAAACNRSGLEAILRHGADLNAADQPGATPVMLAVEAMSTSCAEILLPISDPSARDRDGHQAKDYAPAFHSDPDDPGFDDAMRFSRLLQSLEEASTLRDTSREVASAKPRSL